jgi:hypothetical protein
VNPGVGQDQYDPDSHTDKYNQVSKTLSDYAGDIDFMRQRMVERPVFTVIRDIRSLLSLVERRSLRSGISCRSSSDRSATMAAP